MTTSAYASDSSTFDAAEPAHPAHSSPSGFSGLLPRALRAIRRAYLDHHTRRSLADLDGSLLKDIGLSEADVLKMGLRKPRPSGSWPS